MSVSVRCSCGEIVGVLYGGRVPAYARKRECDGRSHKEPARSVRKGLLVDSVTVKYDDGSESNYLSYPSTGRLKRIVLAIYVKISRRKVFLENEERWLYA